ncbi:MAG: nucleotidyltransferase family protein [Bryobacteraceae bacterium]
MLETRSPVTVQFATPSELLLLRAALQEGPGAVEAAEEWFALHRDAAGQGFLCLEQGSRRLLPLVYRNVKKALPSELRDTLRRVSLQYWADNQKLFRRLEERLAWFQANAVPTLVLKGGALSVLHYRDKGIRPMADFDILVPEDLARDVVGRLRRDGWSADAYFSEAPQNTYFYRHLHGTLLTHPDYGAFDLHWHVLHAATFRGADSAFWDHSVPLSLNKIATRALNPTHQLLHACVHGFTVTEVAPIRWIADALTILRTSHMDWSRLVELARHLRVSIPLAATLSFLRDTFPTPIPPGVLTQLASIRAGASERRYFARLSKLDRSAAEIFADNWERHRRASRDMPPILRLTSLPRQFQLHYNLPRLTDLGPFAFSLLGKRIAELLGRR